MHVERLEAVRLRFVDAHRRFTARLLTVTASEATTPPADGGWTPAQIGAHVAIFNRFAAGLLSGAVPMAQPAPPKFIERTWDEIAGVLASRRLEAPARLHPPASTSREDALLALEESGDQVEQALRDLPEDRAALTFTHPSVGAVSLYKVGEWAAAHTARHNAQLKRTLGR